MSQPDSLLMYRVDLTVTNGGTRRVRVALTGTATDAQNTVAALLHCGQPLDLIGEAPGEELLLTIDSTEWPTWLMVRFNNGEAAPVPAGDIADRILGILTRKQLDEPSVVPRLHAAALADEDGRTVVLLGDSGAGKSTLAAHLVASGLDLVSDEQIAVHANAESVSGFTRPIAVKPGGTEHLPLHVDPLAGSQGYTALLGPQTLGAHHRLAGRPALVVALDRSDQALTGIEATPLSAPAAFQTLAANNLDMERLPTEACESFAALAAKVPAVTLRYESSAQAAQLVQGLLAAPPPGPSASWSVSSAEPENGRGPEGVPGPTRSAEAITVRFDNTAVLYHRATRTVVELNESATTLWAGLPGIEVSDDIRPFLEELHTVGFVTGFTARS